MNKMMNRLMALVLCGVIIGMLTASCSSDNDDKNSTAGLLVGTWANIGIEEADGTFVEASASYYWEETYTANGTFILKTQYGSGDSFKQTQNEGTYRLDGATLTTSYPNEFGGSNVSTQRILHLDDSRLVLQPVGADNKNYFTRL